jgi:hypothetical protein
MTRILDDKSSTLLSSLTGKSQEFANEVSRVTDHAVKAIEAKGFTFTRTMMDNSETIARLINEASEAATGSLSRSIKEMHAGAQVATESSTAAITRALRELQDGSEGAAKGAAAVVTRTLRDLQENTHSAVESSKQTAAAAVSEMLETHSMLRSDTTALFERLREANILLQEVLSGAHDNMSEIESTLVTRVADFVAAMNQVSQQTGTTNLQVEQHINSFRQAARRRSPISASSLPSSTAMAARSPRAVSLIDRSNRRTEGALSERRESLETLSGMLDARAGELDNRLARFSNQLDRSMTSLNPRHRDQGRRSRAAPDRFSGCAHDQTLESAGDRTEIARMVAESTTSARAPSPRNF